MMSKFARNPLDPLPNHYIVLTPKDGRSRVQCRYCDQEVTAVKVWSLRYTIKRHLITQHKIDVDAYVMTQEDLDLDADFELVGKPTREPLQYRKYICFAFDSNAKRASFVYCVPSKELLNNPELTKKDRHMEPCIDIYLAEEDRMTRSNYEGDKLPEGYEKGHLLGLTRFSMFIQCVINCLSDVAIQHRQLNHGHWHNLEKLIEGLLLNYKVRVMVGTKGHLDHLDCSSLAQVPRWWWMVIVSSDEDNTNYRYSAFLFPNVECKEDLTSHRVTIYQLTALVGLNIFPKIVNQLKTTHRSDIAPEDFEEWANNKWFPTVPITGEPDESEEDEPGPSKKNKIVPLVISDEDD